MPMQRAVKVRATAVPRTPEGRRGGQRRAVLAREGRKLAKLVKEERVRVRDRSKDDRFGWAKQPRRSG